MGGIEPATRYHESNQENPPSYHDKSSSPLNHPLRTIQRFREPACEPLPHSNFR
jgi:hypothetical protein